MDKSLNFTIFNCKISICESSHNFQSLTVNPRFVRVPTISEFKCKSTICESSHNFRV
ncbi:hypothetical protein LEP1GSC170_0017 [Leptospira interrogans serovar Bataviae str. HAI135]|nr:hypothetical protein LEP1GSC170_0017 [Leptospira interrogans serovar Bataviae str. HAI135]